MSKKTIKVKFIDMWSNLKVEDNKWYLFLKQHFNVQLSDEPDFVLDFCCGREHLKYDCVKIAFYGENLVPDFNCFDYAMGFDHLYFGDRYLRAPLWCRYPEYKRLGQRQARQISDEELLNRKFCSFVVSNGNGDPIRRDFFEELSKYKPIASGGRYMNNIGGIVKDKENFCRGYKFNIAFENSDSPGYVTEKIMQAYVADTVPIYWGGGGMVDRDFNLDSMVFVRDRKSMNAAIEEIVRLDTDDTAYLEKCRHDCLAVPIDYYEERMADFMLNIFNQDPKEAIRLNQYGWQKVVRDEQKDMDQFCRRYAFLKRIDEKLLRR